MKKTLLTLLVLYFSLSPLSASAVNTQSLNLNGTNQYANIADASITGLGTFGDFTFEGWIKLDALPSVFSQIIAKGSGDDSGSEFLAYDFLVTSAGKLRITFTNGNFNNNNYMQYVTNDNIMATRTGAWTWVAVTRTGSTIKIYYRDIGGVVTEAAGANDGSVYTGTTFDNDRPFAVGALDGASMDLYYFDGRMTRVAVFSDVRTAGELTADSDPCTTISPSEGNLQGYWLFDNNLLDETANNNDLTGVNSPTFAVDVPACAVAGSSNDDDFMTWFISVFF